MSTLMQCGHTANATSSDGRPVCAICIGRTPLAEEINPTKPSLEGRIARCDTCGSTTDSKYTLPFFSMGERADRYYCGCRGWE